MFHEVIVSFQNWLVLVVFESVLLPSSVKPFSLKHQTSETTTDQISTLSVKFEDTLTWKMREDDQALFPIANTNAVNGEKESIFSGARVAFATSRPVLPPSKGVFSNKGENEIKQSRNTTKVRKGRKSNSKRSKRKNKKKKRCRRKRRHRHGKKGRRSRSRRSHRRQRPTRVHPVPTCMSIHAWTQMNESINMNGQRVTVLPYIMMAGERHMQYIYETMCLDEDQSCRGVNKNRYKSECKTKKTYAYAFVRNELGEENWAHIEVRGSCNCALFPKEPMRGRVSLLDLFNT